VEARAATRQDIARIIGDYANAARNAIAAGFDGVQVHGANGYLVDQFLRGSANLRGDEYGGIIDNRLRFMTQVLEAISEAIGMERTGIRFSPNILSQGVEDADPAALYAAVAKRLEVLKVPWIELREPGPDTTFGSGATDRVSPAMREHYSGVIALNSDYLGDSGQARLDEGIADAITFGRPFLANPDLVARISAHAELNAPDGKTFYTQGPEGYTDYPTLDDLTEVA
jgi:2,4-dienoyl-CoA reductase-like NADH-dependent reductase (Old Yellow Enzyme family)